MQGWADTRRAIEQFVFEKKGTQSALVGVLVVVENQERPRRDAISPQEWVGLSISETAAIYATTGPGPRLEISGTVALQVFTALGSEQTARRSAQIVEALARLFQIEGLSAGNSGNISFRRPPRQERVGESDGWWQENLYCSYVRSLTAVISEAWAPSP